METPCRAGIRACVRGPRYPFASLKTEQETSSGNTFDGDTFDSDYIRIEGIMDGDLNVTVKEGQSIWPEWTGENTAEDIAGNQYTRVDNVWYNAEEAPLPEDAIAA